MLTKHLSDEEIQQYALNRSNAESRIIDHIHLCEECNAKIESYQLLFAGIKEQPEPRFDFNLPELVLQQLPQSRPKLLQDNTVLYLLITGVILLAGIPAYLYRGYLLNLFAGIASLFIYLIITTVITVMAVLCFDMYKNYQKKMATLDFY